jgi:hypothetical protein
MEVNNRLVSLPLKKTPQNATPPEQFQNTIVETKTKSTSYLSGAPELTLGF